MHPDSSAFTSPPSNTNPKFPDHEHLRCPRCSSINTKFCYYNNYNLSQPRHFCKDCRRYWTKGGNLRNIPVGGGTRKITKRSSTSVKRTSPITPPPPLPPMMQTKRESVPSVVYRFGDRIPVESGGYSVGPFGSILMEGVKIDLVRKSNEDVLIRDSIGEDFGSRLLRLNDDNNGNDGGDNWPDLSIFTPGSSFH